MHSYLLLLGLMAHDGGGVGLETLAGKMGESKYKVRKMLKELVALNFVERRANRFYRNSFGCSIVQADNEAWADYLSKGQK